MFFNKAKAINKENDLEIKLVEREDIDVQLTNEERHAWNCIAYECEIFLETNRCRTKFYENDLFFVEEIDFVIWMLDARRYSGIEDAVAESLKTKLKDILYLNEEDDYNVDEEDDEPNDALSHAEN